MLSHSNLKFNMIGTAWTPKVLATMVQVLIHLYVYIYIFFWDRVSVCSPAWTESHYVTLAELLWVILLHQPHCPGITGLSCQAQFIIFIQSSVLEKKKRCKKDFSVIFLIPEGMYNLKGKMMPWRDGYGSNQATRAVDTGSAIYCLHDITWVA